MPRPTCLPACPQRPWPTHGLLPLALAALIGTAACGDAAQAEAGSATATPAAVPSSAAAAATGSAEDTTVIHAGDTYDTSDFTTTYQGMAKLPLGNGNVFTDGTCVTLLFEATFLDTPGGRAVFRPAVRGHFDDGRVAENDDTGVGCGVAGVRAAGYESGPRRNFAKDETARVFVGAIHIPLADEGRLAYVTLYGDEDTRFAVEYVEEP